MKNYIDLNAIQSKGSFNGSDFISSLKESTLDEDHGAGWKGTIKIGKKKYKVSEDKKGKYTVDGMKGKFDSLDDAKKACKKHCSMDESLDEAAPRLRPKVLEIDPPSWWEKKLQLCGEPWKCEIHVKNAIGRYLYNVGPELGMKRSDGGELDNDELYKNSMQHAIDMVDEFKRDHKLKTVEDFVKLGEHLKSEGISMRTLDTWYGFMW